MHILTGKGKSPHKAALGSDRGKVGEAGTPQVPESLPLFCLYFPMACRENSSSEAVSFRGESKALNRGNQPRALSIHSTWWQGGICIGVGVFEEMRHCSDLIFMVSSSERAKLPVWHLTCRTLPRLNGHLLEVWERWVSQKQKRKPGSKAWLREVPMECLQ